MTNLDRVVALLALASFLAFLGIVLWNVPRLDLGLVIAVTVSLVCYDLWSQLFRRS
jgi:hypothetical protein